MSLELAQSVLSRHPQMAFIVGNGIHRFYQQQNAPSWHALLLQLWNTYAAQPMDNIPDGISCTEFYDALTLNHRHNYSIQRQLTNDVANAMRDWPVPTGIHEFVAHIRQRQAPLLTTNFDPTMANSHNLRLHRFQQTAFSDYYPWGHYYAAKPLSKRHAFAIWHLHGMAHYPRSIKLSLSHYMGNVDRAKMFIQGASAANLYSHKLSDKWPGYHTWLYHIFKRPLCFIGLGLCESEVFLRWLLIERAKFHKKHPRYQQPAFYFDVTANNMHPDIGKRFFLDAVNIQTIELPTYDNLYEDIWRH